MHVNCHFNLLQQVKYNFSGIKTHGACMNSCIISIIIVGDRFEKWHSIFASTSKHALQEVLLKFVYSVIIL